MQTKYSRCPYVPLSSVIHTLSHFVVQWLFVIVLAVITEEVHSGALRATESKPGPAIHPGATSLYHNTWSMKIEKRQKACHSDRSLKILSQSLLFWEQCAKYERSSLRLFHVERPLLTSVEEEVALSDCFICT